MSPDEKQGETIMIRRGHELSVETFEKRAGGTGVLKVTNILEGDQLQGKSPMFAANVLPPGSSIGYHQHSVDIEAYYIVSGRGRVNDNGALADVAPGDMVYCAKGDSHAIENTGKEDLCFIALKLFA
jgi:mannose-6-phosphate isomerase-like protein (cupin superfamily)